jgi:hypothetical protein
MGGGMADDVETLTVVRRPPRNNFGDIAAGATTEYTLPGCQFAPGPSGEVNFQMQQVRVDATVYAPPGHGDGVTTMAGADVLATDQIRARGDLYDVSGKPQDWGSSGVVIPLRLVTG